MPFIVLAYGYKPFKATSRPFSSSELASVSGDGGDALVEHVHVVEGELSDTSVSTLLVDRHVVVAVNLTVTVAILEKRI